MNPQQPVLETGTLPVELLACSRRNPRALYLGLSGLLMNRMLLLGPTELLDLKPIRRQPLVLRRRIVSPLALRASKNDQLSWHLDLSPLEDSLNDSMPFSHNPAATGKAPYLITSVTVPAPTVLPPSRMAKRIDFSMAIGAINVTFMLMLSPGMTISTPSGKVISPVTSVVRK